LLDACPSFHAMRDPTRGGLAATLVAFASRRRVGIEPDETAVPVKEVVRCPCELFRPAHLHIPNEGKLVAFGPAAIDTARLEAHRAHPLGRYAVRIGRVVSEPKGLVSVRTRVGGSRVLDLPFAEPLPRIC